MKFRSKPVEIEAKLFTGRNWYEINAFVGKIFEDEDGDLHWGFTPAAPDEGTDVIAVVYDILHNTWVGVKAGQWIIKGTKGEFYPCDPEVFEEKYERVISDARLHSITLTEEPGPAGGKIEKVD